MACARVARQTYRAFKHRVPRVASAWRQCIAEPRNPCTANHGRRACFAAKHQLRIPSASDDVVSCRYFAKCDPWTSAEAAAESVFTFAVCENVISGDDGLLREICQNPRRSRGDFPLWRSCRCSAKNRIRSRWNSGQIASRHSKSMVYTHGSLILEVRFISNVEVIVRIRSATLSSCWASEG